MNVNNNNNISKKTGPEIAYWEGVLAPSSITELYQKQMKQLQENQLNGGLRLHKLKGPRNVYAGCATGQGRLLFTVIENQGKKVLLFLGELPDHKYKQSSFVKNHDTESFVNNLTVEKLAKYEYLPLDKGEEESINELFQSSALQQVKPWNCFNDQYFEFTDAQKKVLASTLPALVVGHAGSGKTWSGIKLLHQESPKTGIPCLYLSQEKSLVNTAQGLYKQLPGASKQSNVKFSTFKDLVNIPEKHECVDLQNFIRWSSLTSNPHTIKQAWGRLKKNKLDAQTVYEEMRIISGLQKDSYLKLGSKESLINSTENRQDVLFLFEKYKGHLDDTKRLDLSLYPAEMKEKEFGFIVIDESQDLSMGQLKWLAEMAEHNRIVFLADTHQSIHDRYSKLHLLKSHICTGSKLSIAHLPSSIRCPDEHIDLANKLLMVEYALTGGLSDKEEVPFLKGNNTKKGSLKWYDSYESIETETQKKLQDLSKSTQFAIVTQESLKKEVETLFPNQTLIFTPTEIKGLEYKNILVYGLLDPKDLRDIDNHINDIDLSELSKDNIHRPKRGQGHPEYAPLLNRAHVELTRSTENLIIIDRNKNNKLIKFLKTGSTETRINLKEEESSVTDWSMEADRLDEKGHHDQAAKIREVHNLTKKGKEEVETDQTTLNEEYYSNFLSNNLPKMRELLTKGADVNFSKTGLPPLFYAVAEKNAELIEFLLSQKGKIDVNLPGTDGITPLMVACKINDYKLVQQLLEAGAKPNHISERGASALLIAVQEKNLKLVQLLAEYGADCSKPDEKNIPLQNALMNTSKEIIDFFLRKEQKTSNSKKNSNTNTKIDIRKEFSDFGKILSQKGNDNMKKAITSLSKNKKLDIEIAKNSNTDLFAPIILLACQYGRINIVQSFINNNFNFNHPIVKGQNLLLTAMDNKQFEIAELLIHNKRVNLEQADELGNTPLMLASEKGDVESAKILISHGANINLLGPKGAALHIAAQNRHIDLVKLLLSNGADLKAENHLEYTPFQMACISGNNQLVQVFIDFITDDNLRIMNILGGIQAAASEGDLTTLKYFIEKHSSENTQDLLNLSLCRAVQNNQCDAATMLIGMGAKTNMKLGSEEPLLHFIARNGHEEMLKRFILQKVEIDPKDENGCTPIMRACEGGHLKIVQLLWLSKASLKNTDSSGQTPLAIAKKYKRQDIVKFLEPLSTNK